MQTTIINHLHELSRELGFQLLFACESGSRAWGFASEDSDFDVRFIYAWPKDHYLRIHEPADYVHRDLPGDIDLTGWDLRKALSHVAKSNASMFEWLHSPIVYLANEAALSELKALAGCYFKPKPCVDHYLGLAKQLYYQAGGDSEALNGKKCLYVMRALLSAKWVLTKNEPAPVPFESLLALVAEPPIRQEIAAFVQMKKEGTEKSQFPITPELRQFLKSTQEYCETAGKTLSSEAKAFIPLDEFFRKMIL